MRAVHVSRHGGPEVLTYTEVPDPEPVEGRLLLDVEAAGVNFVDTLVTDGSYPAPGPFPFVPGSEVVGRTADGRRVLARVRAGYAERVLADPAAAVEIPEELGAAQALSLLMQGLTAWHLLTSAARLQPGETVVVHAAAGGVGHLAVQLAREFGAGRVLAVASTAERRKAALDLGADEAVEYPLAAPADVVLDASGGALFDLALGSLAEHGRLVTYGNASRTPPAALDPTRLLMLNASVTGFQLGRSLSRPGAFSTALAGLLELTLQGRLVPKAGGSYPLAEAARAHEDLLARRTMGKLVLVP
ncbi:zinc-binding dehydrogenase [uncultured Streptomyces sp.]|uniref:quinone oxidoreductase family protein n=1 Tax=uncultured Streptomyces sp. TaxID=174707 RepID=UPI00262B6B24|nr:zinc-binding dehydrogenase [uncultured Streptomyces sp.]